EVFERLAAPRVVERGDEDGDAVPVQLIDTRLFRQAARAADGPPHLDEEGHVRQLDRELLARIRVPLPLRRGRRRLLGLRGRLFRAALSGELGRKLQRQRREREEQKYFRLHS